MPAPPQESARGGGGCCDGAFALAGFPPVTGKSMQQETPQHPLHDVQTEQMLLGTLMRDPAKYIPVARQHVQPLDLYEPVHQMVLELIYSFDEEGRAINATVLNAWVKHNPAVAELNKLTGEDMPPGREAAIYLGMIAVASPVNPDVASMGIVLADLAQRRGAIDTMKDAERAICGFGLRAPQPLTPALETVVRLADEINEKQRTRDREIEAGALGDELLQQIRTQASDQKEFGMRTMIADLDDCLGGLYPENLYVIGGRPGMGKSVMGSNLVRAAALQGVAADWWSIEMPARECMARLQADEDYDQAIARGLKGLHYENLVKMRANNIEFERAVLSNGRLRELPISIFSDDNVTMSRIAAVTRARVARHPGMRLVLIDHLHILDPEGHYQGRRVDELSVTTKLAKRLAKRTGSIVVLLAQLSRDLEKRDDKHPNLSDFRDSGSIEQDADVMLGLYRGEYYAQQAIRQARNDEQRTKAITEEEACHRVLDIEVLKQRSGATRMTKAFIDAASSVVRSGAPLPGRSPELGLDNKPF